jgi:hypothetical protein
MAEAYLLQNFIRDMDAISRTESSPAKIVAAAKPLLAKLVEYRDCIEPKFKQRGATEYGRYMLHRGTNFNVTAVVWGPGDAAKAHNHDTWGLVGVVENEIQETRFRRLDDGSKTGYAKLEIKDVLKNGFLFGPARRRHSRDEQRLGPKHGGNPCVRERSRRDAAPALRCRQP